MKRLILNITLVVSTLAFVGCSDDTDYSKLPVKKERNVWNVPNIDHKTGYKYEFNGETEIMCRNIPQWFKKSWTVDGLAYPLKHNDNDRRHIEQDVINKNGKTYFLIGFESELGNPLIMVNFNDYNRKTDSHQSQYIFCEIVNPQEKFKIYFNEKVNEDVLPDLSPRK